MNSKFVLRKQAGKYKFHGKIYLVELSFTTSDMVLTRELMSRDRRDKARLQH